MEVDHASVPRGCGRKSTGVSGAYVNTLMTFLCTSLRSIEKGIGNMHYADYGYTEYAVEDERKCEQEEIQRPRHLLCGQPARGWGKWDYLEGGGSYRHRNVAEERGKTGRFVIIVLHSSLRKRKSPNPSVGNRSSSLSL